MGKKTKRSRSRSGSKRKTRSPGAGQRAREDHGEAALEARGDQGSPGAGHGKSHPADRGEGRLVATGGRGAPRGEKPAQEIEEGPEVAIIVALAEIKVRLVRIKLQTSKEEEEEVAVEEHLEEVQKVMNPPVTSVY